jgi:hypothetical protein
MEGNKEQGREVKWPPTFKFYNFSLNLPETSSELYTRVK